MAVEFNDRSGNAGTGKGTPRHLSHNDQTDEQFPGLKRFMVYSSDGGVNHFESPTMGEGVNKVKSSVESVGKPGTWGYTVHHDSHETSPGIQISGGIVSATAAHPYEVNQRPSIHHEVKPQYNPITRN